MAIFQNSFQRLPKILFETVEPTPLREPFLVALSESCMRDIEWNQFNLDSEQTLNWLNGTTRLPGEQRIATRYAGHQFGTWAGQLGDGRAISLGEFVDSKQQRWEIQTKGSGLTPFSRMGDGKAVIRSSVREFLCSEAMHALGIPTTRALALINGMDPVRRETIERSAIVARVFPSNLRFGHFEYCFHFREEQALKDLVHYTRENFFSGTKNIPEMLLSIVRQTADLIAHWMSVGFCHGVMNTDNMSILGITIDYGPYGFLEETNLNHICNHSDPGGRYSYQNQPAIALWNLDRLFLCFSDLVPIEELRNILLQFQPHYEQAWQHLFGKKLGFSSFQEGDRELIESLLQIMHSNQIDFTYFFRTLSYGRGDLFSSLGVIESEKIKSWLHAYSIRLATDLQTKELRIKKMLAVNPKYILRNYIAQMIIEDVERDDSKSLNQWMAVLENPFYEHPEFEKYSLPTPSDKKSCEVSCSS